MAEFEPLALIQRSVLRQSGGGQSVAKHIQVPYSTLMREINPDDSGAKLGVERFCRVMQVTNDYSPLASLADMCGFTLTPKQ